MIDTDEERPIIRPTGYASLIERYSLETITNWHSSVVATSGSRRVDSLAGATMELYPPHYWPGNRPGDQLEFALKYDGTNLAVLALLFQESVQEDLLECIHARPTGKYARRLWFFYEFLTGKLLPLDDLKQGNYIELLESDEYYTVYPARRIRRQRVYDNLLGDSCFCPVVRRTPFLEEIDSSDLPSRCRQVISEYVPAFVERAVRFLYTRETRSSFAIERINPSASRSERFSVCTRTGGTGRVPPKSGS